MLIRSTYYEKTPWMYKILDGTMSFVTTIIFGYALAVFLPFLLAGKGSRSSSDLGHDLLVLTIEYQLVIIGALLILAPLIVVYNLRLKQKFPCIVSFELNKEEFILAKRTLFGRRIEFESIPLESLRVQRATHRLHLVMGNEHALDIYHGTQFVGAYFFNSFLWSNQKLAKRNIHNALRPFITGGEFQKEKEVDFFKR
jgi:hypothetical protein